MDKLISIFVTSRVEGNANSALLSLVKSLEQNTFNKERIELLVKFDDDDILAPRVIDEVEKKNIRFKYKFGPRLRGYEDIHHGYSLLIDIADENSSIFCCMADDFTVTEMWDKMLREAIACVKCRYFIIHQRPHPPSNRAFLYKDKYNFLFYNTNWEELYIIDEAPAWSSYMIRQIGSFGPISFTDLWTLVLEKELYKKRFVITYFTKYEIVHRKLNPEIDSPQATRWLGARKRNFEYAQKEEFSRIISENVDSIIKGMSKEYKNIFYARLLWIKALACNFLFKMLRNTKITKYSAHYYGDMPIIVYSDNTRNIVGYQERFYSIDFNVGEVDLLKITNDQKKGIKIFSNYLSALLRGRKK